MKWYKKQLDALKKKSSGNQDAKNNDEKINSVHTLSGTDRTTKKAFVKGVDSMAQRNKNRPKTDLY